MRKWEEFFPDQVMELVIPVIPSKDHMCHVVSIYTST